MDKETFRLFATSLIFLKNKRKKKKIKAFKKINKNNRRLLEV